MPKKLIHAAQEIHIFPHVQANRKRKVRVMMTLCCQRGVVNDGKPGFYRNRYWRETIRITKLIGTGCPRQVTCAQCKKSNLWKARFYKDPRK